MKVTKLNLHIIKSERIRIKKQKQIAVQEAKIQKCVTRVVRNILSGNNIKNNIRVFETNSIQTIKDFITNAKAIVSTSENIWAPWSKSFR